MNTRNIVEINQKEINAISGGGTISSFNLEEFKKTAHQITKTSETSATENPKQPPTILVGIAALVLTIVCSTLVYYCKNKNIHKKFE